MNPKKFVIMLTIGLLIATFLRFYNLSATTRFTRDESSNLRDMHRIYRDRDLTLLGPIDPAKSLIHPSLSFYMLMPFAVIGDFTPQSPAFGTAFFGVLTVIVLTYLTWKLNPKLVGLSFLFAIVWVPLLIMSRWAWNPHLVPFIQGLALVIYFQKWKWKDVVSGIVFGLTFHLHFFAFVSFLGFFLAVTIRDLVNKKFKEILQLGLGFAITIIPFVIFDIKNPPGLFFGSFLKNNLITSGISNQNESMVLEFVDNIVKTVLHLGGGVWISIILGVLFVGIIISDLVAKRREAFIYLFPVLLQIFFINYLPSYEERYFYLALSFFWVWLFYPRKDGRIVMTTVLIMIIVSVSQIGIILREPPRAPGGYVANEVTNYISQKIRDDDRMFSNIAVLASPDRDALGSIYRHTLDMQGITFRLENQYDITDNLFVVTTSSEDTVRNDPANLMHSFRTGPLVDKYHIPDTNWKVFLFNK